MGKKHIPRIVVAGTNSGVGKTTIVNGLLSVLRAKGLKVQSYKIGPDYIDPGYHAMASGRPCHNLDSWLLSKEAILPMFAATVQDADIAVIEGVMGLFDGGREGVSSTAEIAKILDAPVILTVDARSVGTSIAATVLGYRMYDPDINIAGVFVNKLGSVSHERIVREAIEGIQASVLGCFPRQEELRLPERHLGLTPVDEQDMSGCLNRIAQWVNSHVEVDSLIDIAKQATVLEIPEDLTKSKDVRVRIGVAKDEAFSFYYPESLAVLEKHGADIVCFSPLHDGELPMVDGLIFGGGFPEMFARQLEGNQSMMESVRRMYHEGIPIYAECGGFMYLTKGIIDFSGVQYSMAGIIPAVSRMEKKLETVGYVTATSLCDNVIGPQNFELRGHEFHFSRMEALIPEDCFSWAFEFCKVRTGMKYKGGFVSNNLLASYLHMHFAGNPDAAVNWLERCKEYQEKNRISGEME